VKSEIPNDLLLRLTLEELENGGLQALDARNYGRAYQLLREATRRAPFRTDLRDALSTAIEGRIAAGPRPRDADQSTLEAMRMPPPARPGPRRGVLGRPAPPPPEAEDQETLLIAPPSPKQMRRLRPGQFERRHRRGPVSALFLGAFVGLILAAAAAGAGWIYLNRGAAGGAPSGLNDLALARRQQVFAEAETFVNQSNFSLAIDRLNTLPQSPERDKRLAGIYLKIGDQGLKLDPPRLQTALDAFSKAVDLVPDDPEAGLALAQVYYALAGGRGGDAGADDGKDHLALARQTLQAVLDRNPDYLPALQLMVKTGIAQRDYKLQQQTLLRIIQVAPPDSLDAKNARRDLGSLGFKAD
jgi:hypothetical protein